MNNQATLIGQDGFRNTKFFQDDSGFGIQIDDPNPPVITTTYNIGDNVTSIVGTRNDWDGQIRFTPSIDPGAAFSVGNEITPLVRTLDELTQADQSRLIIVYDVKFEYGDGENTFGGGGSTTNITDPSVDGFIGRFRNVFGDSDITGSIIPDGLVNITGIIQENNAGLNLAARSLADFEGVVTEDPVLNASPTSLTGLNYFLDGGPSTEKTFTLTGENFDDENVTITAPDDFEIRLAAIKSTYSSTFTIDSYDGVPTEVFVRLKSDLLVGAYSGDVTINFAGDRVDDDAVVAVSGAVLAVPPGLPYAEDFEDFESEETLPFGWTVDATGSATNKLDFSPWADGGNNNTGVKYSTANANLLGYQHTGTTGIFTATLLLINTTGGIIEDLYVSYMGMVAREGEGRSPEWAVEVNGTEVPALFYSTADSEDKLVFAKISGLNIAENAQILIEWSSDRGEPGGSSKQIGIGDVKVSNTAPDPILTVDPEELEDLNYLVDEGPSTPQSFEVSGLYFIDQNVRITAPANFEIAKAEGGPFSNDDLIMTGFSGVATDVFVRLAADLEPGTYTGTITLTVEAGRNGGADAFVEVSGQVADAFDIPYANAFRSIEDNNRAVLQSFEINNADQETGAGGYLKIFPDGYIETPTIDFRDYDYILFGFDARRFGGDGGQELTVKVSTDDGLSYEVMEIIDIVDGPSTENFSYISYVFPLDLTDELNVEEGKLKIEMTDGTQSTRLRDFYILDVTGLTFNTDLGVFYQTLQEAVDNANHGDRIVFKGNFESLNTNTGPGVILAPGSNPPGCAVFTSTFTLTDSDILEIKINGYTPCDDHDQIEVGTVLTLGGADLEIDLGFAPVLFDTFVIMTYGTSIVGEFAQGDEVTAIYDGQIFTFSIEYGDGSVTLEVTNILDPSAIPIAPWAIFLPVIMMLAFVVRRLRKKTA